MSNKRIKMKQNLQLLRSIGFPFKFLSPKYAGVPDRIVPQCGSNGARSFESRPFDGPRISAPIVHQVLGAVLFQLGQKLVIAVEAFVRPEAVLTLDFDQLVVVGHF